MEQKEIVNENIKKEGLSQRIQEIQQGNKDINALILEYIPFIKSSIYKTTGKHITKESEEFSVGLLAFNEAVKSYDAQKGSFLSFANWVIKRRIIDYMRKHKKKMNETNFSDLSPNQLEQINHMSFADTYTIDNPLKLEIDALSNRLKEYDIEFDELVIASPKAKKTKAKCVEAVQYLLENPAILLKTRQNKRLPLKNFKEDLNIPRKFMDRHRKYIIAVVEILSGDYVYLKEYVAFFEKGGRT